MDRTVYTQCSLDIPTIDEALGLARGAVNAGIDWLEAGMPLILGEGVHALERLHAEFPHKPIVADLKTMDGAGLSPLNELQSVLDAVSIPVQAVGGLSIEKALACVEIGASSLVIGAQLAIQADKFAVGDEFEAILKEVVDRVQNITARR